MGFNSSEITIMNAAKRVQLSKIFRTEAAWREYLLRNAVALSQLVGLRMEPDRSEFTQGNIRFDLLADSADGRRILIELQFGKSDHKHLGQVLASERNSKCKRVSGLIEHDLADFGMKTARTISLSTTPSRRARQPCLTAWTLK